LHRQHEVGEQQEDAEDQAGDVHPGGAVGAALELVAVDVVEDGAGDAAEGGVADRVDGVGGAVAAWFV
jgi:hypothetical protein